MTHAERSDSYIPRTFKEDNPGFSSDNTMHYDNLLKDADVVTQQFDPLKLMHAMVNEFWLSSTGLTFFAKASMTGPPVTCMVLNRVPYGLSPPSGGDGRHMTSPILAGVDAASSLSCVHVW